MRQLKIYNSLSRQKQVFQPKTGHKSIKWYSCGPTVYDVSHLGHARCYITFDIIRRILSHYFGYQVIYCMNITDIDDKIIKRARSSYLYAKFVEQYFKDPSNQRAAKIDQLESALNSYNQRKKNETDPAKVDLIIRIVQTSQKAIGILKQLVSSSGSESNQREQLALLEDLIADDQDFKFADTVSDHGIFRTLALKYEQLFHEDMQKLNVQPPNVLTRVSEYIDEIGAFIKKLEQNGYAYRSNGSIYFDTNKFDSDPKHTYAKLVREAFDQTGALDEAEGELSQAQKDVKKSARDFALWKKSKLGEPSWKTQDFESGRPGWHIECSVMASCILGDNLDIHSGGWDLKFPHHDNELAQAEAYYDTGSDWVNYFIHSGHLSISGCKMSKSLKNFITIRKALEDYTARQLRFCFLSHGWEDTLDYSSNSMNTARGYEKTFSEFFLNVIDYLRQSKNRLAQNPCDYLRKWSLVDQKINSEYLIAIDKVDEAICDNFDTRSALNALANLIRECNKQSNIDPLLLRNIAGYIQSILGIFGASFDEHDLDAHLPFEQSIKSKKDGSGDSETSYQYLEALAKFRADVRSKLNELLTADQINKDGANAMRELCDNIRDNILPDLGVRLEDKSEQGKPYVVKFVGRQELAMERAQAERLKQEANVKKEQLRLEKLKLQEQRENKAKVAPSQMFIGETEKYSKFDANGMPTHDAEGKEMSKSALKKLQRLYDEQRSKYEKYLKSAKLE